MSNNYSVSVAPDVSAVKVVVDNILVDTDATIPDQITAHKVATDATGVIVADIHDTDLPGVNTIVTQTGLIAIDIHDTDLPAVKTDTNNIRTVDTPAVQASITAHKVATDASGVITADIHDTDLPAVKTETAAILDDTNATIPAQITAHKVATDASGVITADIHDTDLPAVKTVVDANGVIIADIHDTDLPAVKTETAAILDDTNATIPDQITAHKVATDASGVITANIHDTDLPAVKTVVDANGVIIADIHDTDLPAVKTETAAILDDTNATIPDQITAHKVATDASGVITADIHDTDLPAVKTDTADTRTDVTAIHDTDLPAVKTVVDANKVIADAYDALKPASGTLQTTDVIGNRIVTLSDVLLHSNDAEVTNVGTELVLKKEVIVLANGYYRIKFDLKTSNASYASQGYIYINDVEVGTLQSHSTTEYATKSEDFIVQANDVIQLYIKSTDGGTTVSAQNLRFYGDLEDEWFYNKL